MRILFSSSALKQFSALGRTVQHWIVDALRKPMLVPLCGDTGWKFSVGDFTVYVDVSGKKMVVLGIEETC